jgi:hypothetical protein
VNNTEELSATKKEDALAFLKYAAEIFTEEKVYLLP